MSAPAPTTKPRLAPSDWVQAGAIVSGTIGTYTWFAQAHPEWSGWFLLATTVMTALAQFLYGKGF